jgi:hypothetical protein
MTLKFQLGVPVKLGHLKANMSFLQVEEVFIIAHEQSHVWSARGHLGMHFLSQAI